MQEQIILLSGNAPQIPKPHLHETKGYVEAQTATNNHICISINLINGHHKTLYP